MEVLPDSGSTSLAYRFTGQRWDGVIRLYDYNARYYDPATGRFIQPDTIVPNPGNPQDLNRYTYVRNNPVRYSDPTGHRFDPGDSAGAPSCEGGSAYINCVYPEGHPLAGYPIGTTKEEVKRGEAQMRAVTEALIAWLWEPADWTLTLNRWRKGDFSLWDTVGLAPLIPARGARVLGKYIEAADIIPTGQWHHVFSRKIMEALEEHSILSGKFNRSDIVVRARDLESHRGYQAWHRAYDDEVVDWLETHTEASVKEFIHFLQEIYSRAEMQYRFPSALEALDALITQLK